MQDNLQKHLEAAKLRTWMSFAFAVSFVVISLVKDDTFGFYLAGLFGVIALVSQLLKELITVLVDEKKELYKRLNQK